MPYDACRHEHWQAHPCQINLTRQTLTLTAVLRHSETWELIIANAVLTGMGAGRSKYVTVNLDDLNKFSEGEEVSLETLEQKRIFTITGRENKLPLKVRQGCRFAAMRVCHERAMHHENECHKQ